MRSAYGLDVEPDAPTWRTRAACDLSTAEWFWLYAFQLRPEDFPAPHAAGLAYTDQLNLFALEAK